MYLESTDTPLTKRAANVLQFGLSNQTLWILAPQGATNLLVEILGLRLHSVK